MNPLANQPTFRPHFVGGTAKKNNRQQATAYNQQIKVANTTLPPKEVKKRINTGCSHLLIEMHGLYATQLNSKTAQGLVQAGQLPPFETNKQSLAKLCSCDPSTVFRRLCRLKEAGFVTRTAPGGRYGLLVYFPEALVVAGQPLTLQNTPQNAPPNRPLKPSPFDRDTVSGGKMHSFGTSKHLKKETIDSQPTAQPPTVAKSGVPSGRGTTIEQKTRQAAATSPKTKTGAGRPADALRQLCAGFCGYALSMLWPQNGIALGAETVRQPSAGEKKILYNVVLNEVFGGFTGHKTLHQWQVYEAGCRTAIEHAQQWFTNNPGCVPPPPHLYFQPQYGVNFFKAKAWQLATYRRNILANIKREWTFAKKRADFTHQKAVRLYRAQHRRIRLTGDVVLMNNFKAWLKASGMAQTPMTEQTSPKTSSKTTS